METVGEFIGELIGYLMLKDSLVINHVWPWLTNEMVDRGTTKHCQQTWAVIAIDQVGGVCAMIMWGIHPG